MRARALRLHALVRLGETRRAEQDIAKNRRARPAQRRGYGWSLPRCGIAQNDLACGYRREGRCLSWSGAAPVAWRPGCRSPARWRRSARDVLGDPAAAWDAMRRALDAATPDGVLATFLFHPPAWELFDRYAPDRGDQAALAAEIRNLLPVEPPEGPPAEPKPGAPEGSPRLADPFRLVDLRLSKTGDPQRYCVTCFIQLVCAGDRLRAVLVGAHGPDACTPPLRQTRRARSHRGGRASPQPRPACAIPILRRASRRLTGPRQLRRKDRMDNHDAVATSVTPASLAPPVGGRLWRHRRQMLAGMRGRHVSWT